ncbi:glucokinase [uncultured Algimonas sp.]|uniref:glucokinase n=1 Tax=uncultured Algimonas sp. TaxID=1547920 RepID=UPI00262023D7|nr:glucokinase [uncultured Algimonas sp.]
MSRVLVGDVGGTNVRFALAETMADGTIHLHDPDIFPVREFPAFDDAARLYLSNTGSAPDRAAFAFAGPKTGDTIRMTNVDWTVSESGLRGAFGLRDAVLMNDFVAMAYGVSIMADTAFETVVEGSVPDPATPVAVLGPGTGLGLASILPDDPPRVLATEGGHAALSPIGDLEIAVWRYWLERQDFVSAETLLSGSGLHRVYRALCDATGNALDLSNEEEVVLIALSDPASVARQSVDLFCGMLGTYAGNAALMLGAGSVTLAGGVTRHVAPFFAESDFTARFRERGAGSGYLADMPVRRIVASYAPLYGAALRSVRPASP